MLALIGNLSVGETVVIAVIAILIFGDRLPQVAARAYSQVRKMRRTLDDVRRETGIDRELRQIKGSIRDAADEARIENPLTPPSIPRTPSYEVTESHRLREELAQRTPAAAGDEEKPPEGAENQSSS